MKPYPSSEHRQHFGWLLLITGALCACTKWQVQAISPQQLLTERRPDKVRVTRTDRNNVVLKRPQIVGDSLYGFADVSGLELGGYRRTKRAGAQEAMALADVDRIAIRKTDPVTTALVVAPVVGISWVLFGLAMNQEER